MISEADELEGISYRQKEYQIISELLLPHQQKPVNKVHGLLLLYLHRTPLPQEFIHETKQILPICVRLLHGLVDIVSSLTFLKPLIMTMQLCQMLIQAMWINESPLLQVMDKALADKLKIDFKISDINDFINMEDGDRDKALKGQNVDKIAASCNRYPIVNLTCKIQEKDEEEISLSVHLARD